MSHARKRRTMLGNGIGNPPALRWQKGSLRGPYREGRKMTANSIDKSHRCPLRTYSASQNNTSVRAVFTWWPSDRRSTSKHGWSVSGAGGEADPEASEVAPQQLGPRVM